MNLYYAMGGGLGHLTRAVAFLGELGINDDSIILSSSPFLKDKRIIGNIKTIAIDIDFENNLPQYQRHLQNHFAEINPKKIYIDSFPLGIIGEFNDFSFDVNIEINYIARHLRWINYSMLMKNRLPRFDKTFIIEPLEFEHRIFAEKVSQRLIEFDLTYPMSELSFELPQKNVPFWLIVHSGVESEIKELIDFAAEMREMSRSQALLVLFSPTEIITNISNFFQFNLYPAFPHFAEAERIFTGCGFNVMKQTEYFSKKHFFIPFERRYDDQFWRAAYRRKQS